MRFKIFFTVALLAFLGAVGATAFSGADVIGVPDTPLAISANVTETSSGLTFIVLSSPYLVADTTVTEGGAYSETVQKSVTIHETITLEFPEDLYNYITWNIDQETYDQLVREIDEIVAYAIDHNVSIILILNA